LSRLNAASATKAPATDPRFQAAFDASVALEQRQQYQEAISKFLEAEMYAGKMQNGQYAALESAIKHYRSCNDALSQQAEVLAATKQLIRTLFEEGESLRNAGQLEASVPKFQQVEEGAQDIDDFEVPVVDLARQRLAEVFWTLKRYSDTDAVFDRMIGSVRQPLHDYDSALGQG
jgi:tetratricopeptide (TPR) repeat protein